MPRRKRDYAAEYQRRIQRGLSRGLSRSQARGHPAIGEKSISTGRTAPPPDKKLEAAVKLLRTGKSQKAAAQAAGVSAEKLRRFIYGHKLAHRKGRAWVMTDERPRRVQTITEGKVKAVTVPNFEQASKAGAYWNDAGHFLQTNELEYLLPYIGDGLTDVKGRFIPFETDPNVLHRLASMDIPPFHEIYQITSTD